MAYYTFWGTYFLSISLFAFVLGENTLCSDINSYRCRLQTIDIFNPHRNGSCPTNGIVYLSDHNLTKWILNNRTASLFNMTTQYPVVNQSAEMFAIPYHRDEVPFIDLCGVVYLILSNNSVTVDTLVTILHDQRIRNKSNETLVLKYLDLSYLNISWLPDHIFRQLQLQVLKLNNNPVGSIENIIHAITQLKISLQDLDLSGCGLKYLPDVFHQLQLSKLNISNNLFTTVPILNSISYSLRKLTIDGNQLSVLDYTSFSTYDRIEEISVENCSIYTITEKTFSNNNHLLKLNLMNNNLRFLFPNDIPLTHAPRARISLGNNPWDCTCRNLWLMQESYGIFSKLIEPYKMTCATPPFYANKRLEEIARNVEALDNCDSLFFSLLHKSSPPHSPNLYLFDYFTAREAVTNLIIIAGLFATIFAVAAAVVLILKCKKSNYKSIGCITIQIQDNRSTSQCTS